jgi:AcrR family transcriptional regulator
VATGSRTKSRLARAEQSRQTRWAITRAATALFVRDGFLTATMSAIAAEAGVAVQTLYLSFRSKTAILVAAFDTAIAGDDEPLPLLERDWMRNLLDDPDGPRALSAFIEAATTIMERTSPLYMVVRSAAADPEVAEFLARNKNERYRHFGVIIDALADKPGFATHLTSRQATDLLYTVQSEDTFAMLVHEHGWSTRQWSEWSQRTMLGELFPPRLSR